jgi:hypothetical protein
MAVSLTTADLFTPAPSGVGSSGVVPLQPVSGSWLARELSCAATVQLPTTAWQSGGPERTLLAINAVMLSQDDAVISQMAQGGFLQSAASGTVTYQALNGQQITIAVTPDPSNAAQNPTGALGYLDLLTQGVYDVTRLAASYATGQLAIVNTSSNVAGPYSVGTYHVGNASTGASYHNPSSLTIPSSIIAGTGGTVTGVAVGLTFSIITTYSAHGLSPGQVAYLLIPISSGVSGLAGVFAIVAAVTPTTFQVSIGSSGAWTAGGQVYLCTIAAMTADTLGTGGNAAPGTVTNAIVTASGVSVYNTSAWAGSNWESNTSLAARAQLSLAAASPNGPSQAYVYFAETAAQLLAAETPAYTLTNGPVTANENASPVTGLVITMVASSSPASTTYGGAVTPGCAQLPVTGVTNASPAVVTCAAPTSLTAGNSMTVTISGVLGTAGVNGTFVGTYVGADAFSIPVDTTTAGSYVAGGSVEGGDLGAIDALIQQNVVPQGVLALTQSALAMPISVVATVIVPQAYVATYQLAASAALETYIASLPIGGTFETETVPVEYAQVQAALIDAGVLVLGSASYVRQVQSLTTQITGVGSPGVVDIAFTSTQYQAVLSAPVVNVVGV